VAVPAKELFFTWRPGEVFVSSWALRRVIGRGCLFLLSCHWPSYFSEDSFSYFFCRFLADSRVQEWRDKWQEEKCPTDQGHQTDGASICSHRPAHPAAENLGLGVGRVTQWRGLPHSAENLPQVSWIVGR